MLFTVKKGNKEETQSGLNNYARVVEKASTTVWKFRHRSLRRGNRGVMMPPSLVLSTKNSWINMSLMAANVATGR